MDLDLSSQSSDQDPSVDNANTKYTMHRDDDGSGRELENGELVALGTDIATPLFLGLGLGLVRAPAGARGRGGGGDPIVSSSSSDEVILISDPDVRGQKRQKIDNRGTSINTTIANDNNNMSSLLDPPSVSLLDTLSVSIASLPSNTPSEDRFDVQVGLDGRLAVFVVIDGHGGIAVADIVQKRLARAIVDSVSALLESSSSSSSSNSNCNNSNSSDNCNSNNGSISSSLVEFTDTLRYQIKVAIDATFTEIDTFIYEEIRKSPVDFSWSNPPKRLFLHKDYLGRPGCCVVAAVVVDGQTGR